MATVGIKGLMAASGAVESLYSQRILCVGDLIHLPGL